MTEESYSSMELLTTAASKALEDNSTAFVGTGMPMLAGQLAQETHAPNLTLAYEAGGIGPDAPELAVTVGDERTFHRGFMAASMHDVMSFMQAGFIDFGFIGGAEIDKYGNLNSTVIGDWKNPTVRLPGSGGANDIGSLSHQTVITMRQNKRKFVDEMDYITTPGYLDGPGSRVENGLPRDTGPKSVITQLGVYGFDDDTKEMELEMLHPGVDEEEVNEKSEFEIHIGDYDRTPEPTEEELRLIREELDPQGIIRE